jgi:hypothetical protein
MKWQLLVVAICSRTFRKLENFMNDYNKFFIKLTMKWTSQWRSCIEIFNDITPQTECDSDYNITLNNQRESYNNIHHTESTGGNGRLWYTSIVKHSYKKISCRQKLNSNNKESHFAKEVQVKSKDGLGKPSHLWEGLLISKVSPISNIVGLQYTEKNITRKPNTTMTCTPPIITNGWLHILKFE